MIEKQHALDKVAPAVMTLKNGETVTIRGLTAEDGEALGDFYAAVPAADERFYCPHPLDREHALEKADDGSNDPGFVCLILETPDGAIAGYAWHKWSEGDDKSVFGICLRRDHQGIGAGRPLMERLLESARLYGPPVMRLTVQKVNQGAVSLYQKMGFEIVAEQRRAKDGEPEFRMERRRKSNFG